ncbi:YIP1 family protein [Pelagibacteraceae bacterium]|nr:YIP1 family protein [Pelagibacteraceae bacterium]
MLLQTLYRAVNILKLEKNTYKEISKDNSSIIGSGVVIIIAGLVNVYLFKLFILPTLPNEIPLTPIFLIWIFFNWYIFSNVILVIIKAIGATENIKNKRVVFSLVGFSNTAEIFKILIIFFPKFIVIISWSILMLVIASQVVGVKQIYKLDKISTAVGVVIASYIAQFFIIGLLVFILIKLAY